MEIEKQARLHKEGELQSVRQDVNLIKRQLENERCQKLRTVSELELATQRLESLQKELSDVLKLKASVTEDHKKLQCEVIAVHQGIADVRNDLKIAIEKQVTVMSSSFAILSQKLDERHARVLSMNDRLTFLCKCASLKDKDRKRELYNYLRNLRKAEQEVDLLDDENDYLVNLLEKVFLALEHYSAVLQQYPGDKVRCYAIAPARCMSLNLAVRYADVINSVILQDDFLPRTSTPLEDIFKSIFCLPCLLCISCVRDTFLSEAKLLKDPRRLYTPGRIYHIVERKVCRCGTYPPLVKTAVPVDGRFERIVLSSTATSDHSIVWIHREGAKALQLMEEATQSPTPNKMVRQQSIHEEHMEQYKAAIERARSLNIPYARSPSPSSYGTFDPDCGNLDGDTARNNDEDRIDDDESLISSRSRSPSPVADEDVEAGSEEESMDKWKKFLRELFKDRYERLLSRDD